MPGRKAPVFRKCGFGKGWSCRLGRDNVPGAVWSVGCCGYYTTVGDDDDGIVHGDLPEYVRRAYVRPFVGGNVIHRSADKIDQHRVREASVDAGAFRLLLFSALVLAL